jgi:dienelactone hydrolase
LRDIVCAAFHMRFRAHTFRCALAGFFQGVLLLCAALASAQAAPDARAYEDAFYNSGSLRIQVHVFKPAGAGPFPAIIYNHGSRPGRERTPVPFSYIGTKLAADGYVVVVPERRGYGLSDGSSFTEAVGQDRGQRFVSRMREEADDVLAAADSLRALADVDSKRVGIMGWSLGGIVSVFAASRSQVFCAVIDQAGAALTWDSSPEMQRASKESAPSCAAARHGRRERPHSECRKGRGPRNREGERERQTDHLPEIRPQ